jgi:hypothetical protein
MRWGSQRRAPLETLGKTVSRLGESFVAGRGVLIPLLWIKPAGLVELLRVHRGLPPAPADFHKFTAFAKKEKRSKKERKLLLPLVFRSHLVGALNTYKGE